ncbi:MAG: hypothetical protein ACPG47_10765 [Leucothrix sp.]
MKLSDIVWVPATTPLPASGLLIHAAECSLFKTKLVSFNQEQKSQLTLAYSNDTYLVLADSHHLPWIPGALYLGIAPSTPSLYLPTTLSPSLPTSLIANAVLQLFGPGQYAIDPKNHHCFNVSEALPLNRIDLETLV